MKSATGSSTYCQPSEPGSAVCMAESHAAPSTPATKVVSWNSVWYRKPAGALIQKARKAAPESLETCWELE